MDAPDASPEWAPPILVAIPACDEAERIEACLAALCEQHRSDGRPLPPAGYGVVLVANNCKDDTAARARKLLLASAIPHRVVETRLAASDANPGFARGLALDVAALWLERSQRDGILLTTDADTRVGEQWIVRNATALGRSCSAVAGRFMLDPVESGFLPGRLRQRLVLEVAYENALLALAGRLDPLPHDPWPNHWTASGASYGLTSGAYRLIGGLPCVPVSEDRALAAALRWHDLQIRHDPDIVVTTSARLQGRAQAGCAETLRRRSRDIDMPCDEKLEPLSVALRRIAWRRRLRAEHARGWIKVDEWARRLALPQGMVEKAVAHGFGATWARLEALSPRLPRSPLRPAELPDHIVAAQRLLAVLAASSKRPEDIQPIMVGALLQHEPRFGSHRGNELLGGLVARERIVRGARPMHELDLAGRLDTVSDALC